MFRGIPAHPLGFTLADVDTQTEIPADEVSAIEVYRDLPDGISAESRADAFAIVEQMRADLESETAQGRAMSEIATLPRAERRPPSRDRARTARDRASSSPSPRTRWPGSD